MSTVDNEPIRVLHVDDEPDFTELTATFLEREREDFEVSTATSAAEGLERLTDRDIDCIVSDYNMPGMNGLEFLEAVREEHIESPFILFTGKGSEEIASEAITAGVTDYLNKGSGTDQYTVLANRIENAVEAQRADQRSTEQARVIEVIRGVTQAVVRASTRTEIERAVCDRFADADPYRFAWIGEPDRKAPASGPEARMERGTQEMRTEVEPTAVKAIVPRTQSGAKAGYLDERTVTANGGVIAEGPAGNAVRTGTVQVVQDTLADPSFEPWRAAAEKRGFRSVAAIPLLFEGETYAVLAVYADRPNAFDETEQGVLSELGETIGHAIHAAETRERLQGQYDELFEQAPVMYATTRNRDGEPIIEDCNERFCKTLGYPREMVVGRPLADLYTTESAVDLLEGGGYKRALEAEFISEERRFTARDGSVVETLLRAVPRMDEEGTVIGTLTLFVDVTEGRRAEAVVAQARAMEASMDGMAVLDANGEYTYVNEAHADVYGYDDPSTFLGEHWGMCYAQADVETIEEEAMTALDRNGEWRGETRGKRRDGTSFSQELSLTALDDGGLICVVHDITERKERQRELREEQAFVESIFDAIPDVLYAFDEERTMLRWNEQLPTVTGYSDAEIAEMTPLEFVADEDRETLRETSARVFGEGAVDTDRVTVVTKAGERIPMELMAAPITNEHGSIVGLTGTGRNITEREERQHELERSEALLEGTQRLATVGGWELDLHADELRWTDEVRRIHGLPLDYEPELEEALDFYHPEDAPLIEDAVERAIEDGEDFDVECRLVTAGGAVRWVRAQGKPRREAGETVMLRGAFQDITERREHEQKLETYASMVNSVPDFVYRLDPDGRYIAVNDTAEAVTGYSPAEMRGEHVSLVMGDDDIATGEGVIRDLLRGDDRGQATFEMDIVTADGERTPFECHISVVRSDEGQFDGTVGIVRDITDRKRHEERLRALHEGTREMIEATTREEVCAVVAETSKRVLGHSVTVVRLLAEDGETLVPIVQTDETRERIGERPAYPVGDTPAGRTYREGRARIYDDLAALDEESLNERYDPGNSRAAMYTPVGTHGVISVADTTPERFGRSDLQLAKVLAANAETALDRVEHERRLQSLHEGTRAMTNAETPDEVGELAVETARDALGLALTGCWLYDPDDVCLHPTAVTDEAHSLFDEFPTYTAGNSLSWEVFTTGDPAVYDDVGSHPDAYDPDTPIESEIIVPLGDYGILNCGSTEPGTFDTLDVSAARILAANTEAALERAEREALLRDRETQLEHERDRLAALFENIPDPVYRHNRENGAIVPQAVNPAFERVFGYDEERVVSKPITETIVPEDRIEEHEALAAASGAGELLNAEVERLTATGRRTFLLRNAPIDTPTGDRSVEYAIYTDITDRHKAEEYRRRLYEIISDAEVTAEQRVNGLLDLGRERLGVEIGFLTRIEDGTQRIVEACGSHEKIQPGGECPLSQAYCRRTIEADTPLTLRHAAEAGWAEDPAYEAFGLEAYVGSKLTIGGELYGTVCFADRSPRATDFSAAELAFVDLLTRSVASELERRRYERKLEHQNNRLEEFASVVSHDLRNPLTVAMGYLEFVPEEGNEEFLRKIRNAHDRMERIIEDVLTLARQGQSIGKTSPVDLASVAEQAWNNVETGEAELSIGDDHDLGTIEADEGRLEQVFENLFRNAIEHGGENVTVRIGHSATGFYIEDDGPGIPEDQREQVFDHGHTTSESGTGFGLSIVEQIANAHRWDITVTEGSGGGARFEIGM